MRKIIISAALFTVYAFAASEQACTINSQCPHRDEVCVDSKCVELKCAQMDECAPSQVCTPWGVCRTLATGPTPCRTSSQCTGGKRCIRGGCQNPSLFEQALFNEDRPLLEQCKKCKVKSECDGGRQDCVRGCC